MFPEKSRPLLQGYPSFNTIDATKIACGTAYIKFKQLATQTQAQANEYAVRSLCSGKDCCDNL